VNFRPGIPRYLQIADSVRRDLKADGERIPSEHALCAKFRVSRPTVRQALDVLVQEGRLYRHAGRGTFATGAAANDRRLRVIGSVDDMMALGDETWFKLITRDLAPVPANIAQALRLPPGSSAYRIVGVRHAENGPSSTSRRGCRRIGKALSEEDLSKTSLIGSIERLLNMPIRSSSSRSTPRCPHGGRDAPAPGAHAAAAVRAHLFCGQR
jgi:GntR family transcriptional regulator